jgi:hypothetical protein
MIGDITGGNKESFSLPFQIGGTSTLDGSRIANAAEPLKGSKNCRRSSMAVLFSFSPFFLYNSLVRGESTEWPIPNMGEIAALWERIRAPTSV